eukprot:448338-Rhodomonas_salina.2
MFQDLEARVQGPGSGSSTPRSRAYAAVGARARNGAEAAVPLGSRGRGSRAYVAVGARARDGAEAAVAWEACDHVRVVHHLGLEIRVWGSRQ